MRITILGAGGNIGKRITTEANNRNYKLNLITSKKVEDFNLSNTNNTTTNNVDIFDTQKLSEAFNNSDVVISAYAPPHDNSDLLIEASKSLIEAAKQSNVRLLAVGGAGSLKVAENLLLVDAPNFPEEYKFIAKSHLKTLETVYKSETELNWTNISPSAYIFEGERTGVFRLGENNLIANEKGESTISMEDFAVGIIDEIENKNFVQKRFTIGY